MALRRGLLVLGAIAVSCVAPGPVPAPSSSPTASPAPAPAARPLAIDKVVVEPKEVALDSGVKTSVRFELSQDAAATTLEITDEVGKTVRTLDLGSQRAGAVTATWDGRDAAGKPLPSGVYLYWIRATDSAGATTRFENPVAGGNEVLVQQFTLDPETGTMRFLLPQASRIRLRVGLKGFPLLRTLHDWVPMAAGEHEVTWDGVDSTGKIHLLGKSALDVNLTAFALPGNAILVRSSQPAASVAGVRPNVPENAFRHAKHPLEICHEPKLKLDLPGTPAKGKSGLPVVSGVVPVRITLDPADASHLVDARFEIMLFVDTVFLTEAEEGSNPFTYQLDTRALAPGPHMFTVNVLSYDDHAGTATIQFERSQAGKNNGE